MKKINRCFLAFALAGSVAACNQSADSTASADSAAKASDTNTVSTDGTAPATVTTTKPPLGPQDSAFVMKAAVGGMLEVESGNVALQNSTNERVKAFANTLVTDHTKANGELMGYAAEHGMTLPTSLPAKEQMHIDGMKKMQGKAFDKHFIDMMLTDHKNDISEFEKQAVSTSEAGLKAFAERTLPTLKAHRDTVMALSKMKM